MRSLRNAVLWIPQGRRKNQASLNPTNTVIAIGGSVVYGAKAMEHLREIGTVCYLKLSYESIRDRLGDLAQRGVVLKSGQTLLDL